MRYTSKVDQFKRPITARKQYCPAAGATQGNNPYTQNVSGKSKNENVKHYVR